MYRRGARQLSLSLKEIEHSGRNQVTARTALNFEVDTVLGNKARRIRANCGFQALSMERKV